MTGLRLITLLLATTCVTHAQDIAEAPGKGTASTDELAGQMRSLLAEPGPQADATQLTAQLDDLADHAAAVIAQSDDPALKLRGLTVQMQTLYARIAKAQGDEADDLIAKLRAMARKTKAMPAPASAQAEGDFWLMTAELMEINRIGLSISARQAQAAQLMSAFLERHGTAAMSDDVRATYLALQRARGIEVDTHADLIFVLSDALRQRMPGHWTMYVAQDQRVFKIERRGLTQDDLDLGRGGQATISLIDQGDDSDVSKMTEVENWRGLSVYLSGGAEDWPTMRQDIEAALKTTNGPAISASPSESENESP